MPAPRQGDDHRPAAAAGGDAVVITGRDPERLHRAAGELGARGVLCDASDPAQVAALRATLSGELDVLVNNAGGNTDFDPPVDDDANGGRRTHLERLAASWRANLEANLVSAVVTTDAVADLLAPGGSVISIGTIGAERGGGSYGAAKAALAAWNAFLSAEVGPRGVTANVSTLRWYSRNPSRVSRSPATATRSSSSVRGVVSVTAKS
jgi:3-oxoacyl-[acyl-carrier protein] reductase